MDFKTAVEYLCGLARIEPPHWTKEEAAQRLAAKAQADTLTIAALAGSSPPKSRTGAGLLRGAWLAT